MSKNCSNIENGINFFIRDLCRSALNRIRSVRQTLQLSFSSSTLYRSKLSVRDVINNLLATK